MYWLLWLDYLQASKIEVQSEKQVKTAVIQVYTIKNVKLDIVLFIMSEMISYCKSNLYTLLMSIKRQTFDAYKLYYKKSMFIRKKSINKCIEMKCG